MATRVRRLYTALLLAGTAGMAWLWYGRYAHLNTPDVCLIKTVTGVPCPACGTTRAIDALLSGHLTGSVMLNPFGLFVFLAMVVIPAWILLDLFFGKTTFYAWYTRAESFLRKRYVAIPLVILVICNWIWNIYKGL